ncbi:unnamed protein product [Acanthoscelides obtectus]|uniref:HTH CENPB-type domain-containing protein n=1 Tax=Acanthoscelides obtectus TaxID=200917 RepID=A0A9P0MHF2_ACAOB|nr:unnamed protein product [Acanthoscelides obtectus]CAK1670716.1 hypothetical protein AOBTE_LOCUS27786 [Acanthoscelides obtectus]
MPAEMRVKYTKDQLSRALEAINNGMSVYKASQTFNVPKTTRRDKRDGKYKNEKCGVQPVLSRDEERTIVEWIVHLAALGFPVTKSQLLESVSNLVKNLQRPNPFKDGKPGNHWFQKFMDRHPEISKRVSQNLTTSRSAVTELAIKNWFRKVEEYFRSQNIMDILEDGSRVFNCDESAFFCIQKKSKFSLEEEPSLFITG